MNNTINPEFYINSLSNAIDVHFELMADSFGDRLFEIEKIHLSACKLFNKLKYDQQKMDDFTNEIDSLFCQNRAKIKKDIINSTRKYINQLEALYND